MRELLCGSDVLDCLIGSLLSWLVTHSWVFIIRPHTGVPEIGRLINTQLCGWLSGVLPVASSQVFLSLAVKLTAWPICYAIR
jgi:hypothetical protein